MKHHRLLSSALFTSVLILSPVAQAKDIMYLLQSRAGMSETRSPTNIPYSYTMHIDLTYLDGDGSRDVEAEVRIDPSKPAGSRARIVTTTQRHRKDLTEFLEHIEDTETSMAALANGFWCKSVHDNEDVDLSTYTVISQTDMEAVLKPSPDKLAELLLQKGNGDMDKSEQKMKEKLLDRIDGHIIVSKRDGGTKGFKVGMTRSVTRKTIVKFKTMSLEQNCAVAPNGHRYKSEMKFSVRGKALGRAFSAEHDIRISNLKPIP